MAVDPNIKKKADDIRNKIYGKEVRESLASGLEAMSEDVVENEGRQSVVEGRQDSVESQWQSVSDEMTDKDVISAPEIIAARDGEPNLKARLDKENQEVTAQLAQTSDQAYSTVKHDATSNIIVSFVDDDGNKRVLSHVKPIFDAESVPASVAVITQHTDVNNNFMTSEELKLLKESGWTVANHGHDHIHMGQATEEELEYDIKTSSDILNSHGLDGDILVYPYGSRSNLAKKVARKYSIGAFNTNGHYNTLPLDTFNISRKREISENKFNLAEVKNIVDNAPENSWLIFYTHSGASMFDDPVVVEDFKEFLRYIKLKGIDIVNLREGLQRKGNIVDVGDENEFLKIGRDGSFIYNNLNNQDISAFTPIEEFPLGVSYMTYTTAQSNGKGFPYNSGWILKTYRPAYLFETLAEQGANGFAYQELHNTLSDVVYKRRWSVNTNNWTEFKIVARPFEETPNSHYFHGDDMNPYSGTSIIQDFPLNKITTFYFDSTNSEGFPCNQGMVTTYRAHRGGYDRQVCYEYNGSGVWVRSTNPMGMTWNEWTKIATV